MAERRRHPRAEIKVHVRIKFDSYQHFVEEYAHNISAGGLFIRTRQLIPIGTKVHLEFSLVLQDIKLIESECEVAHIVKSGRGRKGGMGLKFNKLSPESKKVIKAIVERHHGPAATETAP